MLKYEFVRCMDLRQKLQEKIKGGIYITMDKGSTNVVIQGCPNVSYRVNINEEIKNDNIDSMIEKIEYDYRVFIRNKFFK